MENSLEVYIKGPWRHYTQVFPMKMKTFRMEYHNWVITQKIKQSTPPYIDNMKELLSSMGYSLYTDHAKNVYIIK